MPVVTLPNGSKRTYSSGVTPVLIAKDISPSLGKAALAAKVNQEIWDLNRELIEDSQVSIITKDNDEYIELIRHDCAHIMAESVLELYPETQVTIGPNINVSFQPFH